MSTPSSVSNSNSGLANFGDVMKDIASADAPDTLTGRDRDRSAQRAKLLAQEAEAEAKAEAEAAQAKKDRHKEKAKAKAKKIKGTEQAGEESQGMEKGDSESKVGLKIRPVPRPLIESTDKEKGQAPASATPKLPSLGIPVPAETATPNPLPSGVPVVSKSSIPESHPLRESRVLPTSNKTIPSTSATLRPRPSGKEPVLLTLNKDIPTTSVPENPRPRGMTTASLNSDQVPVSPEPPKSRNTPGGLSSPHSPMAANSSKRNDKEEDKKDTDEEDEEDGEEEENIDLRPIRVKNTVLKGWPPSPPPQPETALCGPPRRRRGEFEKSTLTEVEPNEKEEGEEDITVGKLLKKKTPSKKRKKIDPVSRPDCYNCVEQHLQCVLTPTTGDPKRKACDICSKKRRKCERPETDGAPPSKKPKKVEVLVPKNEARASTSKYKPRLPSSSPSSPSKSKKHLSPPKSAIETSSPPNGDLASPLPHPLATSSLPIGNPSPHSSPKFSRMEFLSKMKDFQTILGESRKQVSDIYKDIAVVRESQKKIEDKLNSITYKLNKGLDSDRKGDDEEMRG